MRLEARSLALETEFGYLTLNLQPFSVTSVLFAFPLKR